MSGISDYEAINRAVHAALIDADDRREQALAALATSASTSDVNAIRALDMQSALLAIGAFSMLESILQHRKGWEDPFRTIEARLKDSGHIDLAHEFRAFRLAINVLKHGEGRSYDELLAWNDQLPFQVKPRGAYFHEEGDISEVPSLIRTNERFAKQTAELVLNVAQRLGLT